MKKGLSLVKILSRERKQLDTFREIEWDDFLNPSSGNTQASWLSEKSEKQFWRRKSGDKVEVSETFRRLIKEVQQMDCLSVGAKDIPICLLKPKSVDKLAESLRKIYPVERIKSLAAAIAHQSKPLLLVWVTGFKPRGDDSRPDRGLLPLARMLFGNDIEILTIVSGPAQPAMWQIFEENPLKLPRINGLWEAVFSLSDYILADSKTSKNGVLTHVVSRNLVRAKQKIEISAAEFSNNFSEHDIDTAIHNLFSRQEKLGVFESLCNPPGGDWSGVTVLNFESDDEWRWTSLPRVSAVGGKRPDHIIQIKSETTSRFLAIESKGKAKDLEENIGRHLARYVQDLFSIPPTASKRKGENWKFYEGTEIPLQDFEVISGGAFLFKNAAEMESEVENDNLDFALAFEFGKSDGTDHLALQNIRRTQILA